MLRWDAFVMGPHQILDLVIDAEEESKDLTAWATGRKHIADAEADYPVCCATQICSAVGRRRLKRL